MPSVHNKYFERHISLANLCQHTSEHRIMKLKIYLIMSLLCWGFSSCTHAQKKNEETSVETFKLMIDNHEVFLPCTLADMEKAGWNLEYKDAGIQQVTMGGYMEVTLVNQKGQKIDAIFINPTEEGLTIRESIIFSLRSDIAYDDKGIISFALPGNIESGKSILEDVERIYKEPSQIDEYPTSKKYIYNEADTKVETLHVAVTRGVTRNSFSVFLATDGKYKNKVTGFDITFVDDLIKQDEIYIPALKKKVPVFYYYD